MKKLLVWVDTVTCLHAMTARILRTHVQVAQQKGSAIVVALYKECEGEQGERERVVACKLSSNTVFSTSVTFSAL